MLLPDLHVTNYRLFGHLGIERLARVNLIAGRNNTGKSSLLEAAYLVIDENVPSALEDVLRTRGEDGRQGLVRPLFHGYDLSPGVSLEVSSGDRSARCSIPEQEEIERIFEEREGNTASVVRFLRTARVSEEGAPEPEQDREGEPAIPLRVEHSGVERPWWFPLRGDDGAVIGGFRRPFVLPPGHGEHKRAFLLEGAASLSSKFREMRKLWDNISLTTQADEVMEALRIIEPRVMGVDFLRAEDRVKVLLKEEPRPVLIGSLGDGMRHLLMVAITLVSARHGVLLVDEVDTGLHYTVMVDLWRLVLRTAARLNVQVLASTHSWDCITAFGRAWGEVEESEGQFLRLDREGEDIQPVVYTREELDTAAEQRIEVR